MERNEFSGSSAQGSSGGSEAGNSYSGSESTSGAGGTSGMSNSSGDGTSGDQNLADRARNIAGSAQDKLADVGSTVRDRAGNMKDTLANALETGADRLRQRTSSGQTLAGATGSVSQAIEGDGRLTEVTGKLATGMDATAGWLRDADLDGLKTSIEQQVKEHPGRTLLLAAGLGYLLGKAFRK
jgi:ElaB/YqjD/DUF883 family membrane-anchored ribosome-binding protein